MKTKGKAGTILIVAGLLLFAAALFLTGYNLYDEYRAGTVANRVLNVLQQQTSGGSSNDMQLPENSLLDQAELPDYILNPDMEMPTEEVEGNDYIGVLEIPSLEISLPVMSEWSYPKLKISPCRYSGSAYTGNLVIAAHDYRTHFRSIKNLAAGAQVTFTDVKGRCFYYEVDAVEVLEPTAIQDMISEEWDLTLFTCTPGGRARVAVRCLKTS